MREILMLNQISKGKVIILSSFFFFFSVQMIEAQNNIREYGFKIITKDLEHFWNAYDSLSPTKDSSAVFQRILIDQASSEFQKFIDLRNIKAKDYVDFIKAYPKFWSTIRPLTINVIDEKRQIDLLYHHFGEIYPKFKAPDICFGITPLRSGGTTSEGLILIGTEIAAVNPASVDFSEVQGFLKHVFEKSDGNIMAMVAHELVHTQQFSSENTNVSLLSQAIMEGGASFIASLLLNDVSLNPAIYEYGEIHENELWREFEMDMVNEKTIANTPWFYKYDLKRPADLGYYLGYKICESYYNNHENPHEAIQEIINVRDPYLFLLKSGYLKGLEK